MLVNGNLENWDDTSTPTSWDKAENLTQETTEVHGGSNSALRNGGSGTKDLSQNITGIVGGDSYTISVWYKADGDGSDARIWSFWRTGTTNLDDNVAELRGPNNSYFDNNGNTWSEYSVTLDAPEAADAFFFEVRSYAQSTVYWDDLSFVHNTSYDLLEDFETALPATALAGDSGMATPEVVADPATGGTNGDVLKIVTSAGGNGWQNAQLFFQGDLLDLTTDDKVVTVDVYSESAFMMLAKTATPSNGGAESATDASHTGSGWETLTFDFSDPKDNTPVANDIFGRILFFPQWNGAGWNDSSVTTTYVDNIKGTGYTPPVVYDLLEDFETALPATALAGDSGMATPEVVADPATGGTNGDVLKIVTSAGGNGWQNAQLFFQGDLLDLTTDDKVVTVDVYSESAFMMLAKTATPSNGGAESATDASHTGSGWETLTFDFSDPKDNTPVANDIFGRILFFPQWNGAGWNDSSVTTTYVDNIKGTGYTPPVVYDLLEDFETALPATALAGDSGMATPEVVADPATGGTNGDVLKIVTSAGGNGWQNAQLFFQGDLLDLTTDDKVVTVDVYSESAFMMLAKTATPSNGGAESATDASHTGSGWETLTFDFSDPKDNTPVANDIFGRILFFPQWNGAGWNDSSVTTTYVDNIKGTGYTPPVVYDLLEDFETALPATALAGDSGMATTQKL